MALDVVIAGAGPTGLMLAPALGTEAWISAAKGPEPSVPSNLKRAAGGYPSRAIAVVAAG